MRQPMVTSLGIILGFILNFLANWATEDEAGETVMTAADHAVALTLLAAIGIMCLVLFRLLDMGPPEERDNARYAVTFKLYCTGIVLAFVGVGAALFL
ncbi:hypothetical protein GV829_01105 [Sphingomonas lacunae]|uniref:Uncharacterized protein n=2 Tax=Sphingomonas lacunae TaxID=2698828 RepID=A0A6M4AYQ9_9SPHN|nr:hypothetical protein GV829_01105 [Sphingomonas lacunae]